MNILLGYVGCALAACVILLEFRAVRRLVADTKRVEAVFGPLVHPDRAQEFVVEDVQEPLTLPLGTAGTEFPVPHIEPDSRDSSEIHGDSGT